MKGIFITGTDTGVGKTYVSLCLIAGWREQGLRVGVFKPSETGCEQKGKWVGPQDARLLHKASGSSSSLKEVCPYCFAAPMAPGEAAALEDQEVSFERLAEAYKSIVSKHDITLVEGAGGLLVPYAGNKTTADLIHYLGLPLIVVARIGLGTINHTWLTLDAARNRGLDVLGLVFNQSEDPEKAPHDPSQALNPESVARLTGARILANLPFNPDIPKLNLRF